MWIGIGIGAGVILLILIFMIASYNKMSRQKLRVENAFSQIKIQCKKRADLVPYLADVVKGSATSAAQPAAARNYETPQGLAESEFHTNRALKLLFSDAESNPRLKGNANYLQLQQDLVSIEKAISVSRGFYNDAVMMYNRTIRTFPSNMFASMFRFKPAEFFDADAVETQSVIRGVKCPSCGAIANSAVCPHCGTRIPLM